MTTAATIETSLAYGTEASARVDGADLYLSLPSCGGSAEHPQLFSGLLADPAIHATALLMVGRCARERYFEHGFVLSDPVVTCHLDTLRFESQSSCGSVYARHDVPLAAAGGELMRPGVTNVDLGERARAVLTAARASGHLHLDIGSEAVKVTTEAGSATERKVRLPARWVKGFAEVAIAMATMDQRIELTGVQLARVLRAAPRTGRSIALVPGRREPRWSQAGGPGAIVVSDPIRLQLLASLVRYAQLVTVAGGSSGASCWTVLSPAGRTQIVLSPAASRGFSGEGGTLTSLAALTLSDTADAIGEELAWQSALVPEQLAASIDSSADAARDALQLVAARGRAGYDVTAGAYFHRDLPYDLDRLEGMHGRLGDARRIVERGGVEPDERAGVAFVDSGRTRHRVALASDPPSCTCAWFARHGGTRGPCKHVLAASIATDGGADPSS